MRAYSAQGTNVSGTSLKSLITVIATTACRPAISDIVIGCSATPSDTAMKLAIRPFTAKGTAGATPTPLALDPSDVAAVAVAESAHSAEPTYTGNTYFRQISMNSRGTFRYVASPGFEFKCPATANNGIGLELVSASAAIQADGDLTWFE
jgi:hypothetical protein